MPICRERSKFPEETKRKKRAHLSRQLRGWVPEYLGEHITSSNSLPSEKLAGKDHGGGRVDGSLQGERVSCEK